jgi:hypothetical protein
MKHSLLSLVFIILFSLFELSCNKPGSEDLLAALELTTDKTELSISGLVNAKDSFLIKSNSRWAITISPANTSWLSISTKNGQNNNKIIIAGIEANTTPSPRAATLTIIPEGNTSFTPISINLTQRVVSLSDTLSMLLGKWKYIKDSSTNIGSYYFLEGSTPWVPIAGVYYGQAADYWEFRSNGMSYHYGNNNSYSSPYLLQTANQLEFAELNAHGRATIVKFTLNELVFHFNNTSPNGGKYHRGVYLKR